MYHRAKKSLGQHFLNSQKALTDMIDAGDIHGDDIILEIGPGKGVLTERLLKLAKKVIAIEKDTLLVTHLQERFAKEIQEGTFELIEGDVLDFNPDTLKTYKTTYKLVANIPYNITGAIFKQFLSASHQPERMVVLIQKEVAERIVARDGSESILSLSVKAYGKVKIISKVPARYFNPPPKVDSAILAITEISRSLFTDKKDEDLFFSLIKTGFAHKRKVLIKNLAPLFPEKDFSVLFTQIPLDQKIRPENVARTDWFRLVALLS